ncbi:beta-ketoacyl-ACP synthase III [Haloplasma contractile]|uniref:Beta-ketoacyl-[acyl-carrier-protein] synthase III n=1 Tax=Haloplasma contractile SSD-17B TaxID=1033810 RepID=U2FJL2_9MOLU|nr:beta-ketoacyl-ACP synthase III [Haloplasma contractile]ERJ11449.1 3-oxoacyl-acyl-carrier-protein synthase 3 [Haloplasma contractile SSD-17B]
MNNIKLISTGHYVPETYMTNHDLEKVVDTSNEWIRSRTGIEKRHLVEHENTTDLATKAALNAIKKVDYDKNKIDLIIVATFSPDHKTPSVANILQANLGLNDNSIMAFDVNAACSGFIYAMNVASQMLETGNYKSALIVGAEVLSKTTNWEDRNTCVLFGDGAGAAILEKADGDKPAYFYSDSKGDVEHSLFCDNPPLNNPLVQNDTDKYHILMNGKKVFVFATDAVKKSIVKSLDESGLTLDDIDYIIPHQANLRIIQNVAKSLKLDMDKFYINIQKYGNTSAASIPIALDECLEEKGLEENSRILLVGFGGGLTWGSALITI